MNDSVKPDLEFLKREYLRRKLMKTGAPQAVLDSALPIAPADRTQPLPLSWAQQRLLFLDQLDHAAGVAYNIAAGMRLSGKLDQEALQATLDCIVSRHESLRTTFVIDGEQAVQRVAPADSGFLLHQLDLSTLSGSALQGAVEHISTEEALEPFDLAIGPLIRGRLLCLGEHEHVLLITQHHIISDGWSIGVLVREVCTLYTAFCQGQDNPLPPLAVQYPDYAVWQRAWLQGERLQAQLAFWKTHLDGAPSLLTLPTDRPRPAKQHYAGAQIQLSFPEELSAQLRSLSQRHGTTLFMTLLAGWSVVLARMSGQKEVVVGCPIANRPRSETEGLIGLFTNTLALRVNLEQDPTVSELLAQVKQTTLGGYVHQDLPFEQVVSSLKPTRNTSHNPIFQVTLSLDNTPGGGNGLSLPGLKLSSIEKVQTTTTFELALSLSDNGVTINGALTYSTSLFDSASMTRLVAYLDTLLRGLVGNPALPVSQLPLLTAQERQHMLGAYNATQTAYPRAQMIDHLFEAQVSERPDAIALISGELRISYAELNVRANQLAHALIGMGVKADDRVALCAERSVELVVGMLGILKAGGAYVPLDPGYPAARLAAMLADCAPVALLTQEALEDDLPALSLMRMVVLDSAADLALLARQPEHDPLPAERARHASNLAYVIYTSGSSGVPKGVMIEHRNVVRLVMNSGFAPLGVDDCVAHCASPAFDAATWEIWGPLLNGARLLVVPQAVLLDPPVLNRTLVAGGVSALWLTVGLFNNYADALEEAFGHLRYLLVGGDALDPVTIARVLQRERRPAQLINGYGPTESTTFAATYPIVAVAPDATSVPIGLPIANTQIHLLDEHLVPVPLGVTGELYIGGDGVGRGYLNDADLSARRFLTDPYSLQPGARLYRSGDLARRLADGNIDYQGRNDQQVKIRGYRIELGEIETRLRACDDVRDALVLVRQDGEGDKRLVAYLVPEEGAVLEVDELRRQLTERLASYMVPSAFVSLDAFPLTPNGKLDRKALPAPEAAALGSTAFVAPEGDTETLLATIWQELLGVAPVGRHDQFFDMGGHSLLAVQVISRLRQALGVEVALRELFAAPTLAGFACAVDSASASVMSDIVAADRRQPLPLSWAQQRLWFLDQLDHAASAAYHMPSGLRLSGVLDRNALQATLDCIVARHESLRTTFVSHASEAVQRIAPPDCGFALAFHELGGLSGAALDSAVAAMTDEEANAPFDLARGPLIRGRLLRLGKQEHILLITQHHIISDGWSIGVLVREVCTLYTAFCQGHTNPLPPLPLQYADYAAWQRGWLTGTLLDTQIAYWKNHLQGAPALLFLPGDRSRPAMQRYSGGTTKVQLPAALSAHLRALSQAHGTTLFMTLLAGWSVLLARMSGQDDVTIGCPIANRQRSETEGMIGFFVNTLALRVRLQDDPSVSALLGQVQRTTLDGYAHQELPFEQVVEALKPVRSTSHSPIFQVLLSLNNTPDTSEDLQLPGLTVGAVNQTSTTTQFDLSLSLVDNGVTIAGGLSFADSLFDEASIARLLLQFETLLTAMVADPAQRVSQLALLTVQQREQLLNDFNPAQQAQAPVQLMHRLFEERAAHAPDAVALVFEGLELSYDTLNRRANRLAHRLLQLGVQPDDKVALCAERSSELVIGVLAILKAGGAYVPLDLSYPAERIAYILGDCEPAVVVTQAAVQARFDGAAMPLVLLDEPMDEQAESNPVLPALHTGHLCYVIYTSGSTGMPKGVMVEHGNVARLFTATKAWFRFDASDVWTLFHSIAFDFSVWELWGALAYGGRLVVVPALCARSPQDFYTLLCGEGVTVLNQTPSAFRQLSAAQRDLPQQHALRNIIFGGEALELHTLAPWIAANPGTRLVNMYGITEITVHATFRVITEADIAAQSGSLIGEPIPDLRTYVLDAHLQPVPIGVTGELYIGGDGVARGYLNRPELTAERFLVDPHAEGRLYKSGDLGRWLADGTLEYLGRNDFQVKVRGYRIELGEIEAALAQCEGVAEAIVIARADTPGDVRLVAYVIAHDAQAPSVEQMRAHLALNLAEYMVPSAFVLLGEFPLTSNGKLDRAALPAPDQDAVLMRQYAAPEGEVETLLAQIWQDLLGLQQVGRHDQFFELGGHSLLAVQVISRLRQTLGVELALRELFLKPTLAAFAGAVATATQSSLSAILPADRSKPLPLSWAQQRLWFLDQLDHSASAAYHIAAGLRLTGMLDRKALQTTFDCLVARHESLRTSFVMHDDNAVQHIAPADCGFELQTQDLSHLQGHELESAIARIASNESSAPFDLATGPLIRGHLLQLTEQEHVLLITQHHIISDAWSSSVLVREVCALYTAFSQGQPSPLAPLAIQYPDYAVWHRNWLIGARLDQQVRYWKAHLEGAPALLTLPTDRPRPALQRYTGSTVRMALSAEASAQLRALSQQHRSTLFMTLLAGWAVLMSRMSGQDDIVVGCPIANRQRTETEGLIGFFVNTLALRVQLAHQPSVSELLEQVKRSTLDGYAHQDIPFEQVVEAIKPTRNSSHSPLFQVVLSLNNTPDGGNDLDLPGLTVSGVELSHTTTQFDLSLSLSDNGKRISGSVTYSDALFDEATVVRLLGHYETVLCAMAQQPQTPVNRLPIMTPEQCDYLLTAFNDTDVAYPRAQMIDHLFEAQVSERPDAIALISGELRISYAELNVRANQLAHALIGMGVKADDRVALCAERSVELVVGMLGILKAGGAYVPLDPGYPAARLAAMLADCAPVALLTQEALEDDLPALSLMRMVVLDSAADLALLARQPEHDPLPAERARHASNLAYVIYTSGSSGVPKGVMIEHRNVVRLVMNSGFAPLGVDDCVAHCASPAFDAATWEIWGPLLNGARLLVVPQAVLLDPPVLNRTLVAGGVSALWLTVGLFNNYADALEEAFGHLRYLLVGGDALDPVTIARVLQRERRPAQLINGYGPTESTTFAATYPIVAVAPDATSVPIGLPIANTQIHLLDEHLVPVPLGVTGELYIGGDGVGRGYLNDADLSARRFLTDPYSLQPGARLYRSGDLARRLADGNIDYQGRNDQQVKIRGYRIELGEIETRLRACDDVRDALVLVRQDGEGDKRLVAYLVPEEGAVLEVDELRRQLTERLASYMVPSAFVSLDAFPLTPNGKLDRKALPAPEAAALGSTAFVAPEGDTETLLATIWQELLGVAPVGRHDQFFDMGGHSLLAVQVISRLRQALGVEVALRELFAAPTLAGFACAVDSASASVMSDIVAADRRQPLPLSWAQQRLWFLDQLDHAASAAYHMATGFRLSGALNRDALQATLDCIVARHESLRTCFVMDGNQALQQIAPADSGFTLLLQELGSLSGHEQQSAIDRIGTDEACAPYDLATGPLIRGRLLRLTEQEHILFITQHHIISDGWSIGVLVREVCVLYAAFCEGRDNPLPPLAIQYPDYALWQRQWLQGEALQAQLGFWKTHLEGAPAMLELPTDQPRPAVQSYAGASMAVYLDAVLVADLRTLSQRHGTTLFMTLLSGWAILLARLSGQDDIVIGSPIANRQRAETEHLIGFFVNTLALRVRMENNPNVAELLAQVKATTLDAYAHQDLPFEQVVEVLNPVRSMCHSPVFQTMMALNNTPVDNDLSLPGLTLSGINHDHHFAQFDLSLALTETGDRVSGNIEYASDLFDAETIERLGQQFQTLLRDMVALPECCVRRLNLLAPTERQRVLELCNANEATYPRGQVIQQLFEERVAEQAGAIAVEHDGQQLSYGELNARANQVAHALLAKGVRPDDLVGIYVERSVEMISAMLGVLKAGAAYLPLDPAYPDARLAYMVEDSSLVALLASPVLVSRLGATSVPVLHLGGPATVFDGQPTTNPEPRALGLSEANLAYVIYTSGSTGQPKGVLLEHRNVVNFIHSHSAMLELCAADRVLQFASFGFDSSVAEIFPALCAGAAVVLRPNALIGPDAAFVAFLASARITIADLPTAFWHQWVQEVAQQRALAPECLRSVVVSGEKAELHQLRSWLAAVPASPRRWFNNYGPTEATVNATSIAYQAGSDLPLHAVPIGRPVANALIYVLDAELQPVPVGVRGEIHVGGLGVARGYLRRPELTAQRFIANPHGEGRLYKTGDLGRWLADGTLEYLGRNDFQVKLRGYRIELGEIEAALAECEGVAEAAVLARADMPGELRLVAYFVARDGAAPTVEQLRAQLALQLSEYMVPSAFVRLDAFPLTHNGKLDRKALPAPDQEAALSREYVEPQGETEIVLAQIWQSLLGVKRVGRHDHFFELGGHSLLAVQVISRLREKLGVELALRELFMAPTLAACASAVAGARPSDLGAIVPADRTKALPLSWAQQRLWFLDQLDHDASLVYHMTAGLRLSGELDRAALQAALDTVVGRHESLRTTFVMHDGEVVQHIAPADCGYALRQHELIDLQGDEQHAAVERIGMEETCAPFDLAVGPLIRGRLLRLAADEHVLLITQHHIVSDGWSIGVLVREVSALYAAFNQGLANPLPPLAIQYPDYAAWQRQWLQGEVLQEQLAFWTDHLAGAPALLALPSDRPRPAQHSHSGASVAVRLDAAATAGLRALSQQHGTTLFMTMLAGWSMLLSRMSGQDEVVIGSPIANRQRGETESLIGLFVNTLALRVRLLNDPTVADVLAQVKATMLEAYAHQDLPFEQVVEAVNPVRSLGHSPVFQAMLTLDNTPAGESLAFPGLAVSSVDQGKATALCDVMLSLAEQVDTISGSLIFATELFDGETMVRLVEHFKTLLANMVKYPGMTLSSLTLLDDGARAQLLNDFNATDVAYPQDQLIHQLFEAQAAAQPDALALVFADDRLSYGDLNRRANRLAHRLIGMGVQRDDRVAISVERSVEMLVAVLAVLKAGAGYVPLDPAYPRERLAHMYADSAPVVLLTQSWLEHGLPAGVDTLYLDREEANTVDHNPEVVGLSPSDLAYVIYTSGSTGLPKGVMVEHGNVLNFVHWARDHFDPQQLAQTVFATSINFDLSVYELFAPLSVGGTVILVGDLLATPAALVGASLINTVPSAAQALLTMGKMPASVRFLNVAGEPLKRHLVERLFAETRIERLCNLYGPTETTTYSTWVRMERGMPFAAHIGTPVANTQVYILDACMDVVPIGVVGEIYIGGAGVTRGYLNQPALTEARYLADPFSRKPGARLYKTGDLGRRLSDGNIEYLGRNDFQVKVRGFRIELGEIEAKLSLCDGVREAVVIAREDMFGDVRLVAYVTAREEHTPTAQALRTQLATSLADYMVPAAFVLLDAFPLTTNGKLDRKALPAPDLDALQGGDYVAPEGETEVLLAQVWAALLGVQQVGRHDDFFALGGHSLLAVQVISRLREQLGVELALRDLFATPSLAGFASIVAAARMSERPAIVPVDRNQPLPLSWAQQRLWFFDKLDHDASLVYHMAAGLRLSGELDGAALQAALDTLVGRHESLRTTFVMRGSEAVQQIAVDDVGFLLVQHDLCDLHGHKQESEVQRIGMEETCAPFDLAAGPLIRGRLLRLAADEHVLLITQHHIVSDGWSIGVLVREVSTLYTAFSQGLANPLPPLVIQYPDYAVWQRQWLQDEALQEQLAFWTGQLDGAPALLALPIDRPRPAQHSHAGASVAVRLDAAATAGLRALSQQHGTTLFMTILAGWSMLLSRMSGQDDVVIGSPIANRQRGETEGLIGFFANTLALRMRLDDDPSVAALLAQVKATMLEAYAHQDVPFEKVVEAVNPVRSMGHNPLFQAMFTLDNTPAGKALAFPGLVVSSVAQSKANALCDVMLSLAEQGDTISGSLIFATELFDGETMVRMVEHFKTLLASMVRDPDTTLSRLTLLDDSARAQVLNDFNAIEVAYPQDQLIHQLFEVQAAKRPDALALVFADDRLSYGELNHRANQLAHRLIGMGVQPDDRVALCLERGLDMMVGLLGILKAGAAYVPLDPSYPKQRLDYMLGNCAPVALLTQRSLSERLDSTVARIVLDEPAELAALEQQSDHNPDPQALGLRGDHLAYVIYTSGSTGKPKAVMNQHRGICNFGAAQTALFGVTPESRVLQFASFSFDASLMEITMAYCAGAALHMAEREALMPGEPLIDTLRSHGITHTLLPASALAACGEPGQLAPMTIILGGDVLPGALARLWARRHRVFNAYGPTEAAICAATYACSAEVTDTVPIGRPVANATIYILDGNGQPVPQGVVGELYIGGAGVARGYLNRPELTAERFIDDSFGSVPQARLYRTGDLGRYASDGNIVYLGRNDFQVKIRGFRIELGEIEAGLMACDGVREALVVAREQAGEKRLVAYVVADADEVVPSALALRTQLLASLAEHMVPHAFVVLDAFPLTSNGKLDRNALPEPDMEAVASRAYAEPQGEVETAIAIIWQELIGVKRVGRQDDFFSLGGHSLLAVSLMSRIEQILGIEVPLRALFSHSSLAHFASSVKASAKVEVHANLHAIRAEGTLAPLFLIHPGEGEIGYARALAGLLDADMPIYGLAASGFLEGERTNKTVEEMAACYLSQIRAVQAQGPYRVAGWSAGGTIAYEIANQLVGADETIEFLGLIDTQSDYQDGHGKGPVPSEAQFLFDSLHGSMTPVQQHKLEPLLAADDVGAMLAFCQANGLLPETIAIELLGRHLAVRRDIHVALAEYALPAIPVPVSLFVASDEMRADISLGWKVSAGNRLHQYPVPGDHYSIMDAPNINILAEQLTVAMAKAAATPIAYSEKGYSGRMCIQGASATAPILFCVPGAGASITAFTHLAHALGSGLQIYGMQPRGLCGTMVPHTDVVSAAALHVRTIREALPHGPYHLLGHSFGGWIALEIARQLTEQNKQVGSLFILDSRAPVSSQVRRKFYERIDMLMHLVGLYELNVGGPLGIHRQELAALTPDAQLALMQAKLIEHKVFPARANITALRAVVRVFAANLNASYQPPAPYLHPVQLVIASDPSESAIQRRDGRHELVEQWQNAAPKVSIWDGPGDHFSLLSPPNVADLAEWMLPKLPRFKTGVQKA